MKMSFDPPILKHSGEGGGRREEHRPESLVGEEAVEELGEQGEGALSLGLLHLH